MTTAFQPLEDRILVQPDEKSDQTEAGLYIPASAKQDGTPLVGTVQVLGLGLNKVDGFKFDVKVGDKIMYALKHYNQIENGMQIIRQSDIIGIYDHEKEDSE